MLHVSHPSIPCGQTTIDMTDLTRHAIYTYHLIPYRRLRMFSKACFFPTQNTFYQLYILIVSIGCLAGAVVTHSPLTAAIQVQYPVSECEMVMWSPSQTGGFPLGTPVSSHTKTIRTQTSVPTSMINISCMTCFVIVVK